MGVGWQPKGRIYNVVEQLMDKRSAQQQSPESGKGTLAGGKNTSFQETPTSVPLAVPALCPKEWVKIKMDSSLYNSKPSVNRHESCINQVKPRFFSRLTANI